MCFPRHSGRLIAPHLSRFVFSNQISFLVSSTTFFTCILLSAFTSHNNLQPLDGQLDKEKKGAIRCKESELL